MDNGQQSHDDAAVRTIRGRAITEMRAREIVISDDQNKMALGIFPKVSRLARLVHHSNATLGTSFFRNLSRATPIFRATVTPTRWNSDLDCRFAHLFPQSGRVFNRRDFK
ncbi:hypothetical protein C8R44DRAFT_919962 [Mycena epipterygia]|nr:hypothetical protein C8R44DRAFT_919962 [Mycena epipterygia]